ncbi:MAG: PD40 domain-containing protein, partial [Caldilineaceae bacterium]|nr:PD40 domain-containing protein [Caldilineaceae bacterium]
MMKNNLYLVKSHRNGSTGFWWRRHWWILVLLSLVWWLVSGAVSKSTASAADTVDQTIYLPIVFNGNGPDSDLLQIALIDDQGAWVISADGSRKLLLTRNVQLAETVDELSLHAAPDGRHVAVQRTDGWAVYANNSQLVTDQIGAGFALTWEPDATSLLLAQLGYGIDRFVLADRQRTPLLQTSDETNDHSPLWSNDGTVLAFAHQEFGTHLYVTLIP